MSTAVNDSLCLFAGYFIFFFFFYKFSQLPFCLTSMKSNDWDKLVCVNPEICFNVNLFKTIYPLYTLVVYRGLMAL